MASSVDRVNEVSPPESVQKENMSNNSTEDVAEHVQVGKEVISGTNANGVAQKKTFDEPVIEISTPASVQKENMSSNSVEDVAQHVQMGADAIPDTSANSSDQNNALGESTKVEQTSEDGDERFVKGPVEATGNSTAPSPPTSQDNLKRHTRAYSNVSGSPWTMKSAVHLVKTTLEGILQAKSMHKHPNNEKLVEKTVKNLTEQLLQSENDPKFLDSLLVFEALRACCRTNVPEIQVSALDCLSKLFAFKALDENVLVNPPNSAASNDQGTTLPDSGVTPPPRMRLIDAAVDTITDCFDGEATDGKVELQVVRALASCILTDEPYCNCHGASLLKAVRQIYNIFILSLSSSNQGIAQATLTQIVNATFEKINVVSLYPPSFSQNSLRKEPLEHYSPTSVEDQPPLTLQNLESFNEEHEGQLDSMDTEHDASTTDEQSLIVKDAFLVFRVMSKLSVKPLDDNLDMRSYAVRSKLLALHIIHSIMRDHIDVFLSHNVLLPGKQNTTLLNGVKQYLCLALARNAASPIAPVFEITFEIMWLLVSNLRSEFKREIPVFLTEIYFPISHMKSSTPHQKRYFLSVIQRLCNDPRTLIEFYLNYDCDSSMPNIVETVVDYLTRLALTRVDITASQRAYYDEQVNKPLATYNLSQLPLLSISNVSSMSVAPQQLQFPVEFALKMTSLKCMLAVLRSLNSWADKATAPNGTLNHNRASVGSSTIERKHSSAFSSFSHTMNTTPVGDQNSVQQSEASEDIDDPTQFENLKLRKTELQKCIRLFNFKPHKGIQDLLKLGFIKDTTPNAIAKWLLYTPGLDLAAVGDYLGEGSEENIAIMHAFVDELDFSNLSLVDALRVFLQRFRLPGEGQKIDRFMLKFAERYVDQNPDRFATLTAYTLSYSIILLNTDLHSSQIKNKMTLDEFVDNNRGIDNGKDLPRELLAQLFNEIAQNEIKLQSEQHQAMIAGDLNPVHQQSAFAFFSGKDLEREAYMQLSKEISSKTELVFKNWEKAKSGDKVFYAASHVEHVRSIFETLWMSFLAALTPPFKEYDDLETTMMCLEGLKMSIKISTRFGIDYARASFIGALIQFANLQNIQEIQPKNVNAIIALLEVALSEGNFFRDSWRDVLVIASQVERLQLISKGVDGESVPDVAQARLANHRSSFDSTRSMSMSFFERWTKKSNPIEIAQEKHHNQSLSPEIYDYISSSKLVVLIDRIFTNSSKLSGQGIMDFIKALIQVSREEIESSQDAATPRMFSLQKMVDVCYYNMDRIRVEWTPIWAVLGEAFNWTATSPNLAVVFFAIDSLRQLSIRFLDIEELPGFEFQHDFLKPFQHIIQNTTNTDVQEMCMECFRNFILVKSTTLKSGWKPILESLQFCARSSKESIVLKTYQLITVDVMKDHFESVFVQEDAFIELVGVLREITKNRKYQKLSLHSLKSLKKIYQKVAELCFKKENQHLLHGKDIFEDIWYPVLYSFNDAVMTADDLEVRSRALNFMFDALVEYGGEFGISFWESVCTRLLFPIFGVLSKHWEVNQFNSHDDLSVWLSTTLIQALRNMVALFTHYFDSLNEMLDGFLVLLVSCICQENDTIARIGRSCLQQLIIQNTNKFGTTHWEQVTNSFARLFELTTATELFESDPLKRGRKPSVATINTNGTAETQSCASDVDREVERAQREEKGEDVGNASTEEDKPMSRLVRTKSSEEIGHRVSIKNTIVVKCVLQLLMIESLSELFADENFANAIPFKNAIRLTSLLESSYWFARDFNDDFELRNRLVNARIVDKIPNLMKQETSSSAVLIDILFKIYLNDETPDSETSADLLARLVGICTQIVVRYVALDEATMERTIATWRPVIVEILLGYHELDDDDFRSQSPAMYKLVLQVLDKACPLDLRHAIKVFLSRVGDLYLV
ncbi:AGL147Cp [Eremothecium gossypii ATCC 10895]|uniref:AGL147Cp n=1 Tax=Eremothecium gossypii (strain ATCC 10895 / CBS 109.51 / FGSC 9923 / NRRL Y-1056) TaxID=284811 RepID=Q750T6_EREGS|nr:AGL147Cp [Eremothecium gossypii ATCC 10895]AAS54344.2 AGL147Cp [Eremothecium gossypii ATCC 10895]AEY98671.1 FAGL147Cp [Eremothecium gossypii FDAG1]